MDQDGEVGAHQAGGGGSHVGNFEAVSSKTLPGRTLSCMAFERISVDHEIMGGVPCIRGTRIPVATVVTLVADGKDVEAITAEFPQIDAEDVHESLVYAAAAVRERELPLRTPA